MVIDQIINAAKLTVRKSRFAPSLRKVFRDVPLTKALEIGRKRGWDSAAEWLVSEDGQSVLKRPEFHAAMKRKTNLDIESEFLLTALRKLLLFADEQLLDKPIIQETICTLAHQCLINEYVWYSSPEEKRLLQEKYNLIQQAGDADSVPWKMVAQLLMYKRPNAICSKHDSMNKLVNRRDIPCPNLKRFVDDYSVEYDTEMSIKASIESFDDIQNATSRQIANNYEEYPYPRWTTLEKSNPESRKRRLLQLFDENDLAFMDRPFNVLVAGCGTGYGTIEYALSYDKNAQITAVDLSRASLAYATLMAKKYNANNVKFMQMDLLDLPKLEDKFDIIECTGVLHHMKDPTEGGKALISRLRDGGVIHLSLYSELARQEIVTFRKAYNLDPNMSDDEVREYRLKMMKDHPDVIDDKLSLRADFFDLNRCRDLLFHPLEHRFTIPKIAQLLDELGLEFVGFERPEIIRSQYWTHYPSRSDWRNLSRWDEFEKKHPSAFGSLYQIWARKKANTSSHLPQSLNS